MGFYKTLLTKIVKTTAEKTLRRDANSTSSLAFYQPTPPEKLKEFKRSIS